MENHEQLATKQDLEPYRSELEEQFELFRFEMNFYYGDLVKRISHNRTELLQAFYSYAQSNDERCTELERSQAAFHTRLATLEGRTLEVERRLNIPPAA